MTIEIAEHFESQEINRTFDESLLEIKSHVMGTEDSFAAESAFVAWLETPHPAIGGGVLKSTHVGHLGNGVHECTATYAVETATEIVRTLRYRSTGATARVTQGYGNIYRVATSGVAPHYNGLVGVTRDGVEGVDVPTPSLSFSIDVRFSAMSEAYLIMCHFLTGCINSVPYLGFDAGELLFEGIEGEVGMTSGGSIVLSGSSMAFNFAANPNQSGFTVGPFTVPFKYGWDYLWTRVAEADDEDAFVWHPTALYIDRVHRIADLSFLGV